MHASAPHRTTVGASRRVGACEKMKKGIDDRASAQFPESSMRFYDDGEERRSVAPSL